MNFRKNSKGITLIALVVTIIVLLILAGVSLSLVAGGDGILGRAETAVKTHNEAQIKEEVELAMAELKTQYYQDRYADHKTTQAYPTYTKEKLEAGIETSSGATIKLDKIDGETITYIGKDGSTINGTFNSVTGEVTISGVTVGGNGEIPNYNNEDMVSKISKLDTSGIQEVTVKGKTVEGTEEEITYSINAIVCNEDLVLDGVNTVTGATLSSNVYEFGNAETDVATASEDAKNMVVLKVNGDLTINEGVTLTACKSASGYGGPKGMMIYCTGTLTNNGTISMTARGARAEGENVYLWENSDGSYEYVPAVGAAGGAAVYNGRYLDGIKGANGVGRQTAGGSSGRKGDSGSSNTRIGGAGAAGTSYSGGSGGGAFNPYHGSPTQGDDAEPNGGAGGNGVGSVYGAKGGAGNPGGTSTKGGTVSNGTGGLLIIHSNLFNNIGNIESKGSRCGGAAVQGENGGGSGGGSINIFYKSIENKGTIVAGNASEVFYLSGGVGTVSTGNISTGTYVAE